jgi:hypothetical protein
MPSEARYSKAVSDLRGVLARFKPGQEVYDFIVAPRDEVLARYQPIFSPSHVSQLSKDEFESFLYLDNNHHWSGLYRTGLRATADMKQLRRSLAELLDEAQPIRERFPKALKKVNGMGKGIATGILTIAYPDRYGVWNNTSEGALREAEIWPEVERGDGTGGRYDRINDLLKRLASDLGIDLWTLDALWWFMLEPDRLPGTDAETLGEPAQRSEGFALERQLENFLLENWDRTPLAKDWTVLSSPDEPEAGNQYPTDVGRIDILAVRKGGPGYLVIELKRNQSTDQTVGQVLRYMGWVKKHLATQGEPVEALIVSHKVDKGAQYALTTVANVRLMTYEVEFRLSEPTPLAD